MGIGGVGEGNDHEYGCCDVCDGDATSSRLNILSSRAKKRKARRVERTVNSDGIEAKLIAAREEILQEHASFRMIGTSFLCPDSTIKKLCQEAKFSSSIENCSVNLRTELKDKFSAVMSE